MADDQVADAFRRVHEIIGLTVDEFISGDHRSVLKANLAFLADKGRLVGDTSDLADDEKSLEASLQSYSEAQAEELAGERVEKLEENRRNIARVQADVTSVREALAEKDKEVADLQKRLQNAMAEKAILARRLGEESEREHSLLEEIGTIESEARSFRKQANVRRGTFARGRGAWSLFVGRIYELLPVDSP